MQGNTIDTLQVEIRAITGQFKSEIDGVKGKINELGAEGEQTGGRMSAVFSKIGTYAKVAAAAGVAALTTATIAAAKASWDQVKSVQQASATLGRYYENAEDVTKVQQDLIRYAQSDMGVLFNRKDLFQAAGNLAMYGSSAEDVTKQVQILSRGMASGVLSWDEMNAVVGRVVSSGKLSRTEFEMLAKAGYNLDSSLANTNVTTEEFFNILDSSIPKDISQDMNNIIPVGIRLQSAFRNVGNAILGVNELQDGFLPGSLGERIILISQGLTQFANDIAPLVRQAFQFIGDAVNLVVEWMRPLIEYIQNNTRLMEVLKTTLIVIGGIMVGALLAAIMIVIAAVALLTATIDFLVKAFTFVMEIGVRAWQGISKAWSVAVSFFSGVWNNIRSIYSTVDSWFSNIFARAWSLVRSAWSGAAGWFGSVFNAIVNFFAQIPGRISSFFSSAWSAVRGIWSGAGGWFSGVINSIFSFFANIPSRIKGYFTNALNAVKNIDWVGLGRNIVEGIAAGLNPGAIVEKMKSIASSALDTVKSYLGIKSPSRVMRDEVGKMIGAGMAEGIDRSTRDAVKAASNSARRVLGAYDGSLMAYLPTPSELSSKLDISANHKLSGIDNRQIPVNVQIDGNTLLSFVIDGVNGKSFMTNTSVIDF